MRFLCLDIDMIGISSNINNSAAGSLTTSPSLNNNNSSNNNINSNCINAANTNGNSVSSTANNNGSGGGGILQLSYNLISLSTTLQQFDTIRKWLTKHHKKVVKGKKIACFVLNFTCFSIYFSIVRTICRRIRYFHSFCASSYSFRKSIWARTRPRPRRSSRVCPLRF